MQAKRLVSNWGVMPKMPLTLTHGDFRAENLFFSCVGDSDGAGGQQSVAMVDFQLCSQAWAVNDVTYHPA